MSDVPEDSPPTTPSAPEMGATETDCPSVLLGGVAVNDLSQHRDNSVLREIVGRYLPPRQAGSPAQRNPNESSGDDQHDGDTPATSSPTVRPSTPSSESLAGQSGQEQEMPFGEQTST
eukprot:CAMPEP_0198366938 /NCGR_PEP_ID=MMETSP1450-20131203/154933_1 /TAXON_ID=753684 ORGANISM="Madagascaria erythrocladiodes, Strain CCMP3234" /NCGR_SAMPLE_ID=MMETSP1450 /ASSEMBLY_ACC=CAM_ASM_001115 /LENGTH=117 /DNA_ID=CAMNT_0044074407 /DNA_START=1879 /DNA_END=2228 /DNA_ORIENTATION=+